MISRNKNYAGIIAVYILQIAIIAMFFNANAKLVVFSTVFFVILLRVKSKWYSTILILVSVMIVLLPTLMYRIPKYKAKHAIEAKIKYQIVDFGFGDLSRCFIESNINNSRIFLDDAPISYLYIDNKYRKQLWPESVTSMREKNYTMKARFTYSDLLLGGYSVATVDTVLAIHELPHISK